LDLCLQRQQLLEDAQVLVGGALSFEDIVAWSQAWGCWAPSDFVALPQPSGSMSIYCYVIPLLFD